MILYMLIKREQSGSITYKLGGGSSTPAAPRVYASRRQAEAMLRRLEKGVEIIEVPIPGEAQ